MYQLNAEKMFFDMSEGQAIAIDFTTGMYYGTGLLGSVIMERLIAGNTPENILIAVKKLAGCPTDMDAKMNTFVQALLEKEIIVEGPTQLGGQEPIPDEALADGWELSVDEFAEVQDLLLADPIHEVEVEKGWPIIKEG